MKQRDWYAGRDKIVRAQRMLTPILEHLEKVFRESAYDNDPVTNRAPISVIGGEQITEDGKAFAVQSVTGGNVTLVLPSRSAVIQVVPPIDVGELKQVSAITGVATNPRTSLTILSVALATGDRDEKQVSLEAFHEAVEDAVLVEEPASRWGRS